MAPLNTLASPPSSVLTVAGKDVQLATELKADASGAQCACITAVCGATTLASVATFMPNPDSTLVEMQNALDLARQRVAREAAGRENIRTLAPQLK